MLPHGDRIRKAAEAWFRQEAEGPHCLEPRRTIMKASGSIRCTYFRDDDVNFQLTHTVEVALPFTAAQQVALLETILKEVEHEIDRRGYSGCSFTAKSGHHGNGVFYNLDLRTDPARDAALRRKWLTRIIARLALEPMRAR